MKKLVSLLIILNLFLTPVFAATDTDLPVLPTLPSLDVFGDGAVDDAFSPSETPAQVAPAVKTTSKQIVSTVKTQSTSQSTKTSTPKKSSITKVGTVQNATNSSKSVGASYTIPKGKKFKVVLNQQISSDSPVNTRISFTTVYPEPSRYLTLPAGTVFYGKIANSHPPQLSGNGGLIVIEVQQMSYKGKTYNIDAKVSVADGKRIYFNNIKGKRMYFQSFPKAMKPGTSFFKKMWKITCTLAKNESGVEIILTPFSFITGSLVYAVNLVASPVLAIFYKGKSITIPKDSRFTIQLREDALLYK